jgi:cytochrome P450
MSLNMFLVEVPMYLHAVLLLCACAVLAVAHDVLFRKQPEFVDGRQMSVVPPRYPLLGHLPQLLPANIMITHDHNRRRYGKFVDVFIFNDRKRVICDAAVMKEMLSMRPKVFQRPLPQTSDGPFPSLGLGSALFNAEGALWGKMRRLISPHFSRQNVASMAGTVCHECMHMIRRLRQECNSSSSRGSHSAALAAAGLGASGTVEMDQMAQIYTVRVVGKVALGITSDAGMDAYFGTKLIIADTKAIFRYLLERQLFPLPKFFWRNSAKFTFEEEAVAASKRIESFTREHIRDYKASTVTATVACGAGSGADGAGPIGAPSSLIDSMLRAAAATDQQDGSCGGRGSGAGVTDAEISENVRVLFIAGSETTSSTITWALYLLYVLDTCGWLGRLREEAEAVFLRGSSDNSSSGNSSNCAGAVSDSSVFERMLSHEELRCDLPVTLACVKEAIRLYPAVSFFGLSCAHAPGGGVTLSNGMRIASTDVVWAYPEGALKDECAFGAKPDLFNPARWFNMSDAEAVLANSTLDLAFGGGPRVCPGMGLAIQEATAFLAYFAVHFDAQLACPVAEVTRVLEFTAKANKMPMVLTPRQLPV